MAKLGRRRVIQVSLEDDKGTAVAGATDVLVYEPTMSPEDNTVRREPSGTYGGNAASVRGPGVGTCTFRAELRSNGAASGSDLDDGIAICLQGCGWQLDTGVYAPITAVASQKTITIDLYEDGLQKRLYGAMGNVEITGEFGQPVMLAFTFTGIFSNQEDTSLPATSHTSVLPMQAKSCTLTLGSYTPKISRFALNLNCPVEMRPDVTAAEGVAHAIIGAGRDPVVTMDPEHETAATWDINALWEAGTEAALSLVLSDGTVAVTIAAPKLQHRAPQDGTRESVAVHEMTAQANASSGDDEITITPAAA